ncbi:CPBP family intramembrane glutamic endopeptidase [Lentilactobacillus kisonensis]|uniref:CAAX amino terminal protease family protein n=2 Tax=Lentilactobacillus kisonensis TaxID=481722 RepID=H1LKX2_9LACO|nr:type II CAAX endopeptidase family protein [Lentilactobacillus kisonensis]EHO45888.1 CAAX amino terminal protease family protein [Lentilactobacillus kisonensis F0435]KRL23566.1 CAAX amino terminal protease family protein [Lentilactobacillus kisonensis DSM 19906 = JCM 15041]
MDDKSRHLMFGDYFERIMVFIGLFIVINIVQVPLGLIASRRFSNPVNNIIGILYLIGFALAIWVAVYAFKRYAKPANIRLTGHNIKWIVYLWLGFFVIEVALGNLNRLIYHVSQTSNNEVIQRLMTTSNLTLILMAFTAVFCSPILEELVFRGFLIGAFFNASSFWGPIVVSAVLFAIPHMETINIISFLTYAILGGVLGYLFVKTRNIKVSIGLHFLNNLIAVGMMIVQIVMVK